MFKKYLKQQGITSEVMMFVLSWNLYSEINGIYTQWVGELDMYFKIKLKSMGLHCLEFL